MFWTLTAGTVSLTEAGKKIAARNAARIKAAIAAMQEMLAEVGDVEEAAEPAAGRELLEAMLRTSDSADAKREKLRQAVRDALREKHRDPLAAPDAYPPWVWVRDFFPSASSVVYDCEGALYQATYTVTGEGDTQTVTVGDPVEVEVAYVPKGGALTEAADLDEPFVAICLEEKAVRADGTTTLKVINPGWGSSGYYPKEVLERDGPKVFTAGTKMYADHPTAAEEAARPERSIKDLAAVLTGNARWENAGPDGPGLYAEAKVYDTWRKPIDDMAADIGVSIRAAGRARMGEAEGRKGPIVEAIVAAKSIDFVTDAGRGGKILPLSEAARQRNGEGTRPALAAPSDGGKTAKEVHMPLSEAEQARITTLEESVRTLTTTAEALAATNRALVEGALRSEARTQATGILASIKLPEASKTRLVESLGATPPVKDGALDRVAFEATVREAAKAEGAYVASLTGGGGITGFGAPLEEAAQPKAEDAAKALEEGFKALGLSESAAKTAAAGR